MKEERCSKPHSSSPVFLRDQYLKNRNRFVSGQFYFPETLKMTLHAVGNFLLSIECGEVMAAIIFPNMHVDLSFMFV